MKPGSVRSISRLERSKKSNREDEDARVRGVKARAAARGERVVDTTVTTRQDKSIIRERPDLAPLQARVAALADVPVRQRAVARKAIIFEYLRVAEVASAKRVAHDLGLEATKVGADLREMAEERPPRTSRTGEHVFDWPGAKGGGTLGGKPSTQWELAQAAPEPYDPPPRERKPGPLDPISQPPAPPEGRPDEDEDVRPGEGQLPAPAAPGGVLPAGGEADPARADGGADGGAEPVGGRSDTDRDAAGDDERPEPAGSAAEVPETADAEPPIDSEADAAETTADSSLSLTGAEADASAGHESRDSAPPPTGGRGVVQPEEKPPVEVWVCGRCEGDILPGEEEEVRGGFHYHREIRICDKALRMRDEYERPPSSNGAPVSEETEEDEEMATEEEESATAVAEPELEPEPEPEEHAEPGHELAVPESEIPAVATRRWTPGLLRDDYTALLFRTAETRPDVEHVFDRLERLAGITPER